MIFEEHLESPTNERMRLALAEGPPNIELLEEFKFRENAVINRIEQEWILKEIEAQPKGNVLNVQHNRAVVKVQALVHRLKEKSR